MGPEGGVPPEVARQVAAEATAPSDTAEAATAAHPTPNTTSETTSVTTEGASQVDSDKAETENTDPLDDSETTHIPESEEDKLMRAAKIAEDALASEIAAWQRKKANGLDVNDETQMSQEAYTLWLYGQFKGGFPEGSYTENGKPGITITNGLEVTAIDEQDVQIVSLREGKTVNGERLYTCLAKDPGDPNKTVTVDVSAAEVADRFLLATSDPIAKNFSGDVQKIVDWYAKGSKDPLPMNTDQLAHIEAEQNKNPLIEANKAIGEQTRYFDHLLKNGELTTKQEEQVSVALAQLKIGEKTQGDLLGAHYKAAVLANAESTLKDLPVGDDMARAARNAIGVLDGSESGSVDASPLGEERKAILEQVPPEKQAEVKDLLENAKTPADMFKLLTTLSPLIPNLSEGILGKGITESDAQIMLDGIIKNSSLTKEQKDDIIKFGLKVGGKGLLGILIAILATGAVAVVGAVGTVGLAGNLIKSSS